MRFGMSKARHRDDYIVCTSQPITGADTDGNPIFGTTSVVEFYGQVTDMKSDPTVGGGKRRDEQMIHIECNSEDITDLTINHSLQIDGRTETYQVVDIHDTDFRFTSMVVARYTR